MEWTSDAVAGGPIGSPVFSADGQTVYVSGRDRRLWALNASDGKAKWSAALDFAIADPAIGRPGRADHRRRWPRHPPVAFRDAGDKPEELWRRDDVTLLTTSSQAGDLAYTVVADGPDRCRCWCSALPTAAAAGAAIHRSRPPGSRSVSRWASTAGWRGATSAGQVYSFSPA